MKAAVLGIGTELTDGQIVNKNASWISKKLKDLGLTTKAHLVVPDERPLMLEGIEFCAAKADLIFITGGLGPTSDDFTRDVVADWAGRKLLFDEGSWQHVNDRLTSRGYVVKDIQRQQCYFPEGATILPNREGTANGFSLEAHGKKVFVLPGPPREIEAVWDANIQNWIAEQAENLDPYLTRKWDTLGVGESDVAVIVEEVLKGIAVEKGYRVHLPYVEVKASYYRSEESALQPAFEQLTEALQFCTLARDGEDAAEIFADKLKQIPSLCVIDEVTGQFLMNRLMPVLRGFMTDQMWSFSKSREVKSPAGLHLHVLPKDEHSCEVSLEYKGRKVKDFVTSPYKSANMKERRHQYFAEMALIFWVRNL
ncbi:competence/damage-inducible protein A [Bdellovibrio bacteriovorus]|uniref:Nucleotide-utilizing enzyme n=1 Tax=Bdellovibrio bacteriovorus str. Tiberius TaxID=1069642 RepID=K7ZEW0_BDEBC|nr:competence/damage-inducible protein A [Bdellovibrio bacteriovorus]AFY00877.1 nucleotide-utilizing enzyme [Bdellovibrio bacteriovorus str. Tiberius]